MARTSKALLACSKAREAGRHANPCPAPGDGKAAGAIAAAVARTQASICKTCGGPDRACGGVDDLAPAVLGYPDTCPAVTDPDGSACGGPISTLSDLVDCVTCVAGHLAECTDHAAVPAFLAYPPECAAPGYQVRKPVLTSKDPTDAANAAALVKVLTALGGTATGTKHNDVHFATPLAAQACTGFAAIEVPLRKGQATQKTLRGCGELGTCQDNDRLKLRCLPAS